MRADGEVERGGSERQRTDGEVLLRPLYSLLAKVHAVPHLSVT